MKLTSYWCPLNSILQQETFGYIFSEDDTIILVALVINIFQSSNIQREENATQTVSPPLPSI